MRKIFTFLCAALMSVGMFATTVVTITDSDFPASESSFTKDGVTVSAYAIDGMQGNISGPGSFSTTLGNFTKIELSAASISVSGEGWSGDYASKTWTGNASSVSFTGTINGYEEGTTLVFTIEPAAPADPNREYLSLDPSAWTWGYNSVPEAVAGGIKTTIISDWGALSMGWDPERDLSEWDKIVFEVSHMDGCDGQWFKLKAYLRDVTESEPNQMEGLLGLDAPDNQLNYLVIDLHQNKACDLTKARILAVQCEPTGGIFTISSVYLLKESAPEPVRERVIFGVKTPVNGAPAAGIMLSGSFTEEPLTLEAGQGDAGWYVNYNVMAAADDTFIIYDAADDNNAIFVKNDAGEWELGLFAFGEVWTDDTWKGDPVKWVELDMSDNSKYAGANAIPEGVDNITAEAKAVKVLRNGEVLILMNGKTFNLLGAEVK